MAKYFLLLLVIAMTVSACAQSDMQGVDPKDYYTEHPVKNTIETRHMLYTMDFRVDKSHLSGGDIDKFQSAMRDISPGAVESVTVNLSPSQMNNRERRQHITKLLRGQGFDSKKIHFEAAKNIGVREAALDVAYAVVVNPHCPDWRVSPVTTYSNTTQPNFGCATAVNLGSMVEDPHDLEEGKGEEGGDTAVSVKSLQDYRTGDLITSTTSTASGSGSSATSGSAAAQ